jgi:uncharacterized protein (TIGR03435 family)
MKDFEQRVLERMPSPEEERASLGRVWSQVERAGGRIPDEVLRSVQQQLPRHQRAWTFLPFLPRAVAAVLVLGVAIGTAIVWPRGVRVYAAGNDGLQVTLADDSRVEMRAHAEMAVGRASDGIQIDLKKGDIIVTAAKQRGGQLSVRTNDMTVAVEGTAFLANAGQQGSRVGVIEGEVRVREGDTERRLRPGEQVATSPTIARRLLAEDIAWSRNANVHRAKVDSFMKGVAQTTAPITPVARQADVTGAQTPGATAAALEFEEASIRPCDPDNLPAAVPGGRGGGGASSIYMTPGRFYALCATPAVLIRQAYGYRSVNQELEFGWYANPGAPARENPIAAGVVFGAPAEDGQRVRGGPDWVRTERYTIEAVAGGLDPKNDVCAAPSIAPGARSGGPSLPAIPNGPCKSANATLMSRPMLLALLERRFGLKAHIVTEQTTAYNLVIAPGGLKMKEGTCTTDPSLPSPQDNMARARQMVDVARRNLDAARRGNATTGLCGTGVADNGPNRVIVGAGWRLRASPSELSSLFRGILGAPVTDRTGIPDMTRFNFALEFLLDDRTKNPFDVIFRAGMDMQIAADPSRVQPAPDLFTALEQQLGLRLEPTQVPRDYIVIDAIKRLEPN